MPQTAAFIDAMRDAFGAEHIDAQIRKGMNGQPGFYAEENGHKFGAPIPEPAGGYLDSQQYLKLGQVEDAWQIEARRRAERGRK